MRARGRQMADREHPGCNGFMDGLKRRNRNELAFVQAMLAFGVV